MPAIAVCWLRKFLDDFWPIFFTTKSINASITATAIVIIGLKISIMAKVPTTVTIDINTCDTLCSSDWFSISTSFVNVDISSPCECLSKYDIGNFSICENISSLILWTVFCASFAINKLPIYWESAIAITNIPIIDKYIMNLLLLKSPTKVSITGLSIAFIPISAIELRIINNIPLISNILLNLK